MKVILQKDVPNLGDAGDIKDVASGFARNYLLPKKLVIPASVGSTRALQHQQEIIKRKIAKRTKEMEAVAKDLAQVENLEIPVRVGAKGKLFGSVTGMQVSAALREKGFPVDKRKIELGDKIKALGTYKIKVRLADSIIVPLSIEVVADETSQAEAEEEERLERESEEMRKAAGSVEPEAKAEAEGGEAAEGATSENEESDEG